MRYRQDVKETTLRNLFGDKFRKLEGKWYLINQQTIVCVCYSKVFHRTNYNRYFFGVQQNNYNNYRSSEIGILFVCGDVSTALLLPGTILDELLKGVPVARDGSWKFDIHRTNNYFELHVTGKKLVFCSVNP